MLISAIQLHIDPEEGLDRRLQRAMALVREEADGGADLVVLPEMWLPGFFAFDDYEDSAVAVDDPVVATFAATAREAGVVLHAGSIVERDGQHIHNTSLLFDASGTRVARYRKIHLFPYGSEEAVLLTRGDDVVVVDACGARVGLATCYDLRYPELFRAMVDDGAELFLVVAGWPFPRVDAWRILGRSRAIENQAALVACNSSGRQGTGWFCGASYACDPWGVLLGELADRPGVLRCAVDVDAVRSARDTFPALAGRVLYPQRDRVLQKEEA